MVQDLPALLSGFAIDGVCTQVLPHKSGNINDSYVGVWRLKKGEQRFLHQRINHKVFKDVSGLMRNILAVTAHLQRKIKEGAAPAGFCTIEVVKSKDGKPYLVDAEGEFWRSYKYISDIETHDRCPSVGYAIESGRAFGLFQKLLSDLPGSALCETIPHFDNVPLRFESLAHVVSKNPLDRVREVREDIAWAEAQRDFGTVLEKIRALKTVPQRVTHYDTKINNILFKRGAAQAVAVADLDTVMPGLSIFDYGDLLRSAAVLSNEDEKDLKRIVLSKEYIEALSQGYLSLTKEFLTLAEIEVLHHIPAALALALGVRFLTDYLQGDIYFRIAYPQHNLVRARAQFQIVKLMQAGQEMMKTSVKRALDG